MIARAMRNTLIISDKAGIEKELDRIEESRKIIEENLDKTWNEVIHTREGKEALPTKFEDARSKYVGCQDEFLKLTAARQAGRGQGYLLTDGAQAAKRSTWPAVTELIEFQTELDDRSR